MTLCSLFDTRAKCSGRHGLIRSPADACFLCRNRRSVGLFVNTLLTNSENSRTRTHRVHVARRSLHR